MKRILVIEDEDVFRKMLVQIAESMQEEFGQIEVLEATTLEEAEATWMSQASTLDAILLDGCVPGKTLNVLPFVRVVRALDATVPIIAVPVTQPYCDLMVANGCTVAVMKGNRKKLTTVLRNVLAGVTS